MLKIQASLLLSNDSSAFDHFYATSYLFGSSHGAVDGVTSGLAGITDFLHLKKLFLSVNPLMVGPSTTKVREYSASLNAHLLFCGNTQHYHSYLLTTLSMG